MEFNEYFHLGFLISPDDILRSVMIHIVDDSLILDISHVKFMIDAVHKQGGPFESQVTIGDQTYWTFCYKSEGLVILDLGESRIAVERIPYKGWRFYCSNCGRAVSKLYKTSTDAPFTCEHCTDEVPDHDYNWLEEQVYLNA